MAEALRSLIEAARKGDRKSLNELAGCADRFVRIFSGRLSNRLRRTTGSTIDFVLEGLAEAFAKLGDLEYKSDEQFYAWVASYIRGRMLDAGRRAARGGERRELELPPEDAERVETPEPSASAAFFVDEVRAAIGEAIVELQVKSPLEMEAVVLKAFEGQSWPEMRSRLGLTSEKRARTLFSNGVALLRPLVSKRLGKADFHELLGM